MNRPVLSLLCDVTTTYKGKHEAFSSAVRGRSQPRREAPATLPGPATPPTRARHPTRVRQRPRTAGRSAAPRRGRLPAAPRWLLCRDREGESDELTSFKPENVVNQTVARRVRRCTAAPCVGGGSRSEMETDGSDVCDEFPGTCPW